MEEAEITRLINRWVNGSKTAYDELYDKVYTQLKGLAHHQLYRERRGHTLNTTALVNEVYVKLLKWPLSSEAKERGVFWGVVATAMRQILMNYARDKKAAKKGGGKAHVSLNDELVATTFNQEIKLVAEEELLLLDKGLVEFNKEYPRQAKVVELRYFAGCTFKDVADSLEVSEKTAKRDWAIAKAWLKRFFERANS